MLAICSILSAIPSKPSGQSVRILSAVIWSFSESRANHLARGAWTVDDHRRKLFNVWLDLVSVVNLAGLPRRGIEMRRRT